MSKKVLGRSIVLLILSLSLSSAAFAGWTSLAYNPQTKAWGRAQCEDSYQDAVDIALNSCGDGCQTVAYSYNGYVALAAGDGGWATGGLHDTVDDTQQDSLNRCAEKGISNCQIVVTGSGFCD